MRKKIQKWVFPVILTVLLGLMPGCSSDDEPTFRNEGDILGVWTDGEGRYINFDSENRAFNLYVRTQDGMEIGLWEQDGYFYEPGYNLLIYMDQNSHPQIYQVLELTEDELVWCWVEDLRDNYNGTDSIGEIIGQIIQNAHDGYPIDPEKTEFFSRVPEDRFLDIIDSLNLALPW